MRATSARGRSGALPPLLLPLLLGGALGAMAASTGAAGSLAFQRATGPLLPSAALAPRVIHRLCGLPAPTMPTAHAPSPLRLKVPPLHFTWPGDGGSKCHGPSPASQRRRLGRRGGPLAFAIQPAAFKTSVNAVLRLVSSCGLGLFAASRGLLDQGSLSTLSRLIFAFFQPALLFTNVCTTLANPAGNQASLLVLPVFAVLQILVGSLYGKALAKLLKLDPESDEGKELAVCSAFANSGPLPLLFADAFFRTHADPGLYPRAVAYISFYLVAWSPLFWTYGATILGAVKGQPAYHPPPPPLPANSSSTAAPLPSTSPSLGATALRKLKEALRHPTFRKIVSPPTMGCVLGALVGATPSLRQLFIGPGAPLACLFDALRTMGSAYLPTVLLVLAGSLAQGLKELDASILGRTLAIMVSRFAFMPATAFVLLRAGLRLGLIPVADKLLWFILLLQACMPCAQNTVVILQLQKRPQAAASMAKLVSLIYILAIAPMGFLLSAVLQYVGL